MRASTASKIRRSPPTTAAARRFQAPVSWTAAAASRRTPDRTVRRRCRPPSGRRALRPRGRRGVAPGDPPVGVARPGGHVGGVERAAQRRRARRRPRRTARAARELQPLAGDVADAHHGAAGRPARPSISRWRPRGWPRQRAKASPRLEQPLDRLLDLGRLGRVRARAEAEHARRPAARRRRGRIAFDRRLGVGPVPGDQDLRLAARGTAPRDRAGRWSARVRLRVRGSRRVQLRRPIRCRTAVRPTPAAQHQDGEAGDLGVGGPVEREASRRRRAARASARSSRASRSR